MRSYQNSQLANLTNTSAGAVAQFNAEPDLQAIIGAAYIGQLDAAGSVGTLVQNVARQTINRMVFRDNPRLSQTLQSLTVSTSIQEVIRQMKIAGASVLAPTITMTPTSFIGVGNGVINTSNRRPLDGLVMENSFSESLLVTCSSDSFTGGSIEDNETFTVTGTGAQSNVFAFNWPLGSNATAALSAIDGNADNSSGNILTNSGFEDWTSNVPDNFTLLVGTAGTNIIQEMAINYDGTSSIRLVGDAGGTLTAIRQQFEATAGTSGALEPLTQYSFNVWARRDAIAAATGVLTIELVDNNGVVIQDANSQPNSFTIDLTVLTTSFVQKQGVFRTPVEIPAIYYIRLRLSTALTNGRSVYFDKASLGEMTQIYTSGPFLAIHAGGNAFNTGDYATVAVVNSRGAAGTLDTFQTLFARFFFSEMIGGELVLPSSSTPTISDGLIG